MDFTTFQVLISFSFLIITQIRIEATQPSETHGQGYHWENMQRVPDPVPEDANEGGLFGLQAILEGDRPVDLETFILEDH